MNRVILCAALALSVAVKSGIAQEVLVSPTSVIFEGGQRSAQLFIGNTGDVTSLYTLEPAFFRMEPGGRRTEIKPPFPENNAAELIRFSPRQFELPPGSSQTVRVATRLPSSLPPGEYRVHLRVTNLGGAVMEPQIDTVEDGNLSVAIRIQVSRAIRVLVRHGVSAGRGSLAEVSARRAGGPILVSSELARSGEGSSRGSYRVYTRSGGAVRDELINRGVLVYSELSRRTVEHTVPAAGVGPGVELCVAYRDETAGDGGEEERCVRPG